MPEKKRRNPKQARSQATVDAILEATFHILETQGQAKLTTNLISERAGVSIGTLYQYFSDRDAILAAMGQRQAEAIREEITRIMLEEPEGGARPIIQALMHGLQGSAETRIILGDALIRARGERVVSDHHNAFLESLKEREELGFAFGREASFVLTHAVVCLLRAAAAEPELGLEAGPLEDELVLLIESYLAGLTARAQKQAAT
jgi:AcrR family transcriptional regulator